MAGLASACHGSPAAAPSVTGPPPTGPTPAGVVETPTEAPSPVLGADGDVAVYPSGAVWFCVPIGYDVSGEAPPPCDEVRVVGVDVARLPRPARYRDGTLESYAYLTGILRDGTLHVTNQGAPVPEPSGLFLQTPPCGAPPDGWAKSPTNEADWRAVGAYRRRFPSDVIDDAQFTPARRTPVITLASINPERTSAHLTKAYPRKLCVVRSLYTRTQVFQARKQLSSLLRSTTPYELPYVYYGWGPTITDDGQPHVEVDVLYDTPALEHAIAPQPAGLVQVVPWLAPVTW